MLSYLFFDANGIVIDELVEGPHDCSPGGLEPCGGCTTCLLAQAYYSGWVWDPERQGFTRPEAS